MEDQTSIIGAFFEKTEHYMKTGAELLKMKAIDKSADVISTLAARFFVIAFIAMFFFILNIGIALWIGEALGVFSYGFFIVAGFYAFVGILFYLFRNTWVKIPVRNSIITQALN